MKLRFFFVCLLAIALLSGGCGGNQAGNLDFTVEVYEPECAAGFEILGADDAQSSLLRVTRPWQGDDVESFELLILRGGESAPSDFRGAVIEGDARRIVALSSSTVAMFDRLGDAGRIVGVSGLDYISSLAVRERAAEGLVRDIGYDSNLNYELITLLRPDIVLLYSVAGRNSGVTSKLDELKIPYIYIGEYAEESPLGKAEWMVAMGEICGKRAEAESLFKSSADRYNTLKEAVKESEDKPSVMLNTPYRDIWYMPSKNSYMVQLLEDAGGRYIYDGNSSAQSKPISVEEAYKLATQADIWLNTGATINSLGALESQVPKFKDMAMVKRGQVYNNTARCTPMGGSDFWESGVVYPELVLADLIQILHPSLIGTIEGLDGLYYYQKLE